FKAGASGWMDQSEHPLPPLIATADRFNNYAEKFLRGQIIAHAVNSRVHAEIHPHKSETNGTRSFRFSYSHPALQQMPKHDKTLAPLIRRVCLPEAGEDWCTADVSQQEFRLAVHYAVRHKLTRAEDMAQRYRDDAGTDFHAMAAEWARITRQDGKTVNFAK